MIVNIGPATLTFGGSALGKTAGGGYLSFIEKKAQWVDVTGVLDDEQVFVGVEGVLKMFSLSEGWDGEALLYDWNELVIDTTNDCSSYGYVMTIPSCRLYFPQSMRFGTLQHQPFELRFVGRRTLGGVLITIS